jgi:exodeoxyribonuclease V alpha subunit
MQINGTILNVIFRNAENGFTVITLSGDSGQETVVGIFPPVTEGEEVSVEGERVVSKFGEQIKATSVRTRPPRTPEGIIKYLSSGLFKGIGIKTAEKIVAKYSQNTFEVIENNPLELMKIPGITAERAMIIADKFKELRNMQDTIIFLQKYDISLNLAIKIFKCYKAATQSIVGNNPYRLIYDVDGIGFFIADRIAIKIGIDALSPERLKAAVNYVLYAEGEKSGNTYLPEELLINNVIRLLSLEDNARELIRREIESECARNAIIKLSVGENSAYMLRKYYELEKSIADKLIKIKRGFINRDIDNSGEIDAFCGINGIELNPGQISAINAAVSSGGVVITGGPGTGKTTIIKCIISIFKARGEEFALCAPTGRAAKRLSEATGEPASTIHRLLNMDFSSGRGFFFNENTKLTAEAVIVDEVSMADEYVFHALISAVKTGARLIIVGDKDQLPSVGAGNVLADIISSNVFKIAELTEIYRQESESFIIINAHKINKGLMPALDIRDKDFFFIECDSPVEIQEQITSLASSRLPAYLNIPSDRVQVLCPMKRGITGIININKKLQETLNPQAKSEMEIGEIKFKTGDKVIQLNNNYQLGWIKDDGESGEGVFNGDIGIVEHIDNKVMQMRVRFDDERSVTYSPGDFDQLALAYAITIHKSQGSEFDAVIIALTPGSRTIMTRNLLYTAITRAKKLVVLVGSRKTVSEMVKNNYTSKRFTLLRDFIMSRDEEADM